MNVTCPHCGGHFDADSHRDGADTVASAADHAELGDDEMRCRKCGERQPRADACRACGLRADRMDDYRAPGDDVPEHLRELWREVESSWSDEAAHDRFLEAASVAKSYAFAARCYRSAAAARPGDAAIGARMERVTRMAEAALMSAPARSRDRDGGKEPYRGVVVLLITLVFLAAVGGAILVIRGLGRDDSSSAAPPPVPGGAGARPTVVPPGPRPVLEPHGQQR